MPDLHPALNETWWQRLRRMTLLDVLTWTHILIIQWIPWLIVFALQDRNFRLGLVLGLVAAILNFGLSWALWKTKYIKAFPKWLDLCFILVFVPLTIAAFAGTRKVQDNCWAWFPFILNGSVTLCFLVSIIATQGIYVVMDQYYQDFEPEAVWKDPYFKTHNFVLNWMWFVAMLLMTAATGVSGATVHRNRTHSVAGIITAYFIQFSVFFVACVMNVIYSLYMRRYYLRALHAPPVDPETGVSTDPAMRFQELPGGGAVNGAARSGHIVQQEMQEMGTGTSALNRQGSGQEVLKGGVLGSSGMHARAAADSRLPTSTMKSHMLEGFETSG